VCLRLCVCQQDYCKSNHLISLKLDNVIEPTNGKNRSSFDGHLFPDTDLGSLFYCPQHWRMGYFRRFISISHTVASHFLRNLVTREWFPGSWSVRKSGFESRHVSLLVETTEVWEAICTWHTNQLGFLMLWPKIACFTFWVTVYTRVW